MPFWMILCAFKRCSKCGHFAYHHKSPNPFTGMGCAKDTSRVFEGHWASTRCTGSAFWNARCYREYTDVVLDSP
jgi:hypothetical protein